MISWLTKAFRKPPKPRLEAVCARGERSERAAILLLHGFTADAVRAFGYADEVLRSEDFFSNWDVYRLQYQSNLRLDTPIWHEPDLEMLGRQLSDRLKIPPLSDYKTLFLVGHSMGGLLVQRAMLDAGARANVGYVLLLGTPSLGARAARLLPFLKQAASIQEGSHFISNLRRDWNELPSPLPFEFRSVAANGDAVVGPDSSLAPFPEDQQFVIEGDHASIARIDSQQHPAVAVMKQMVVGGGPPTPVDSALLAIEHNNHRRAVELLLPNQGTLDRDALVALALALDAIGESRRAIEVLQSRVDKLHSDALGTLAGRYKRLWLRDRHEPYLERSLALYEAALAEARKANGRAQIMYQAINLAFLHLLSSPNGDDVPQSARAYAFEAYQASITCDDNYWKHATQAEANLILGETENAVRLYAMAAAGGATIRERGSTCLNASFIVARLRKYALEEQIRRALFG